MPFTRAIILASALLIVLSAAACVEDKDYGEANSLRPNVNRNVESNTNQNIADDSVEKLDTLINLPYEPVENVFREERIESASNSDVPAKSADKRLVIVLRFSPEDTSKIIEKAAGYGAPFEVQVEAEPWFPAELIAKGGTSGNEQLSGTGYSARDFATEPWINGSLIKIDETDYFVLLLQTNKSS